jgi:putative transposase
MTHYQLTLDHETVQRLFGNSEQLRQLLEAVVNQVLEAQVSEHLQAEPYERTEERRGYRNGYKPRQLTTRVGTLALRVPQVRDGSFSPELFARYQRSEQALVCTLMEMVVSGVSTRKVAQITEELCGKAFSKSTVSELCQGLDPVVSAWNERDLSEQRYPFVVVDALVLKIREDGRVRSRSALLAIGVNETGYREILGLQLGDSEAERSWMDYFVWLKGRLAWIWSSRIPMAAWSMRCVSSSKAPPGNAARPICPPTSATRAPKRSSRPGIGASALSLKRPMWRRRGCS